MRKPFRIMFWILVGCAVFALPMQVIMMIFPEHSKDRVTTNSGNQKKTIVVSENGLGTNRQTQRQRRAELELRRAERTPEHNLAIIHEGWKVPENHITVIRFRYLLEQLDARTIQSKREIADMTVNAHQILRNQYGREYPLLGLMEEMHKMISSWSSYSSSEEDIDYGNLMAIYMHTLK